MPDYLQASKIIYNEQKKILTKLDDNIKIYSVRGNCDTNCISDVLESVRFIDMEDKLTEEDLINLHKLDLDHVFVSKEEYDILKTTPIFQYMPWLTYHKSIKTSQNA